MYSKGVLGTKFEQASKNGSMPPHLIIKVCWSAHLVDEMKEKLSKIVQNRGRTRGQWPFRLAS